MTSESEKPEEKITADEVLPPTNAVSTLLSELLVEFAKRDPERMLIDWLADTAVARTNLERPEARKVAKEIVGFIDNSHQLHDDLSAHLGKGKSRASWIAKQIEKIASEFGLKPADAATINVLLAGQSPEQAASAKPQDWNDISSISIAQGIEQQSILSSAQNLSEAGPVPQGDAASHPEAAKLAEGFIDDKLDTSVAAGLQATLAMAAEIAARKGLLGEQVKKETQSNEHTASTFAYQVFVETEKAKILHAVGQGTLDPNTAVDMLANIAAAAAAQATKEVCKHFGGRIAEILVSAIPVIGHFLSPAARTVGELAGSAIGEMAGGAVGRVINKGIELAKPVAKAVVQHVKELAQGATEVVKSGFNALKKWFS